MRAGGVVLASPVGALAREVRLECGQGPRDERRLALATLLLTAPVASVPAADHAEMRAALREIETARRHLESAKHDYRGHRPTAVEELRQAEEQIRKGIDKGDAKEER